MAKLTDFINNIVYTPIYDRSIYDGIITRINVDESNKNIAITREYKNLEKGENDMNMSEILNIYEDNKINKIKDEYDKKHRKISEENDVAKLADKLNKQAIKELEKIIPNYKEIYDYDLIRIESCNTKEIKEELDKLYKEQQNKKEEVDKIIKEVKAMLQPCETYEQKMNVLKSYNIIDKDGRIIK